MMTSTNNRRSSLLRRLVAPAAVTATIAFGLGGIAGCDTDDDPADALEEAGDNAADAVDDAADAVGDAIDDVTDG